jgi:heme O synthase-like polyprenyltransferase
MVQIIPKPVCFCAIIYEFEFYHFWLSSFEYQKGYKLQNKAILIKNSSQNIARKVNITLLLFYLYSYIVLLFCDTYYSH